MNAKIYPGRQWLDRFKMYAAEFPKHYWKRACALEIAGFSTLERLTLEQALGMAADAARPFPAGTAWGKYWEYGWFFVNFTVPKELAGKHLIFLPGVGEEMLVWVNGAARGAVDKQHSYVTLTRAAEEGQHFQIVMECYAGHGPRMEAGCFCKKEEKPFSDEDREQIVTVPSCIGIWQEEVFQAAMDFLTLYSLMPKLPPKSLRAMKVTEGLKKFTLLADFELPEEEMTASLKRADEVLKPLLACKNGTTAPEFTIFGQSHLDLAWLWSWEETRRKAARTYSNQLELMEEYPEYQFLLCEPPIPEYLKESYPEIWERVEAKRGSGQIFAEGALYVESDTNMPCGESLARQFLYGKEWFERELGVDSRLAWMPDTFGFSPALPQIMKQCGVPYFTSQKLIRQDPECEPFPYNDFWWEGIDGTRILGHTFKKNNARFNPADLITRWEEDRVQAEGMEGMLYPFGFGDGGGGPTREMLEMARRCEDLEGAPRTRYQSPVAYFEALEERGTENVFTGELYLAWHRGTYTAQAKTKKGVRRAEVLLKEAEYWNTVAAAVMRTKAGKEHAGSCRWDALAGAGELRQLWKRLLLQEFHDILPGTSIAKVHEVAETELKSIALECEALLQKLFEVLQRLLPEAAEEVPEAGKPAVTGRETAQIYEKRTNMAASTIGRDKETGVPFLASEYLYAELDAVGRVVALHAGEQQEAYLLAEHPMNAFRLYKNVNSYYDAWEIGSMYEEEEDTIDCSGWQFEMSEYKGRPAWQLKGMIGSSPFTQYIALSRDGRMLEFHTQIDWKERHRMLKVDFPSVIRSNEVISEIAFGNYKRPTTNSYQWEKDRYEMSAHRYSALENGRNGIAVFNDSKYGFSAKQDRISLTLLRGPVMPDMYADQGMQEFSYACYPYEGMLREAAVVQRAVDFNKAAHISPALLAQAKRMQEKLAFARIKASKEKEACHVVTEAVKLAEDGSGRPVIRLYEATGCPQRIKLTFGFPVQEVLETDILEKNGKEVSMEESGAVRLEFGAYEIKTLLVRL